MPVNEQRFKLGLVLILLGLGIDFIASNFGPSVGACMSVGCTVAEDVASASLFVLIFGILVQAFAITRVSTPVSSNPQWAGTATIPPQFPPSASGGFSPPVPPPAAPVRPPIGIPTAPPTAMVRCPRCQATYPMGQFAYCSACGAPLPFTPS